MRPQPAGEIKETLSIPDSSDVIVLLDPERRPEGVLPWHPFPNVARVAHDGRVVWTSALMPHESTAKCWHAIHWDGGRLIASTYSYLCELDPATGRIIEEVFTK